MDIEESIELGGENLAAILGENQNFLPYWAIWINEDMTAECNSWWPTHNIGRWWDAVLRIEASTDFVLSPDLEGRMLQNLERCLNNPLHVPCYLYPKENPDLPEGWIDKHSQREILLALTSLLRYRNNEWAGQKGREMISRLDELILENGRWDDPKVIEITGLSLEEVKSNPQQEDDVGPRSAVWTHGRLLEPLVEFYQLTGEQMAIDLATRIAEFHYEVTMNENGDVPPRPTGGPTELIRYPDPHLHTHSLLGTYRGLFKYGEVTRQHKYIDVVEKTYQNSIRAEIRESGFISHDWGSEERGDIASAADIAQLGLWLAQHGYSEYLDDVQRIIRARVLPSQLIDLPPLSPVDDADNSIDSEKLKERTKGAFGGIHRSPHGGTVPTTDVTAATLHSLCDIYENIVDVTDTNIWLNLYFDYEDEYVSIETDHEDDAEIKINPKTDRSILLRIPSWASSVQVSAEDTDALITETGSYYHVAGVPQQPITLTYDLPSRTVQETLDGEEYNIRWAGDTIQGISPNDEFLPFYPDMESSQ